MALRCITLCEDGIDPMCAECGCGVGGGGDGVLGVDGERGGCVGADGGVRRTTVVSVAVMDV